MLGHGTDNIDSPPGMPIFGAVAPVASGAVAVCSRHIERKSAFVEVHDLTTICLVLVNGM